MTDHIKKNLAAACAGLQLTNDEAATAGEVEAIGKVFGDEAFAKAVEAAVPNVKHEAEMERRKRSWAEQMRRIAAV